MGLAAQPFEMKVGDLLPALTRQLLDSDGVPVDLSTASYVMFALRPSGIATHLLATYANVVNPSQALVEYDWGVGETSGSIAAIGTMNYYQAEFEVMWPASKPQTFPNQGYIPVIFLADII